MKRMLLVMAVAFLQASCTSLSPQTHRTAPSEGTASHPGKPPVRLEISREMPVPSPSGLGQRHPAVAWGDGVYLLVWREGFGGFGGSSNILALRIGPDGKPLDNRPIPVCPEPGVQGPPSVAFCDGGFLVAWESRHKRGEKAQHALRMRQVAASGELSPAIHALKGNGRMHGPAVASNGKDQFLLIWHEYADGHYVVRGGRVSAATGKGLDDPHLDVMSRHEKYGLRWSRGAPLGVAWTGEGYVVCQGAYAAFLGPAGRTLLPIKRIWSDYSPGGSTAAAAWGKGFVFHCMRPWPDPWGWGGNAAIVGITVTAHHAGREREEFMKMVPDNDRNILFVHLADGRAVSALDVSRWLNHPGWPMGMAGGFKHAMGDLWPSGTPAAGYNGESLVVVWPRGHMVDNRRLANRDLYLTRVLSGWGLVDRPPVPVSTGPTEETNPVLCAGPRGRTLLAYEKVVESGVAVRYRLLSEQPDTDPPAVEYVVPMTPTKMVVSFDEPLDEAGVASATFRIDGLTVKSAAFVPGGRALRRQVILTTSRPEVGRNYTLCFSGVKDRSPAGNVARDGVFTFLAKPGFMQRREKVTRWATDGPPTETYPNPSPTGSRDYIARWNMLGPLPLDGKNHPFDPSAVLPSPGDEVQTDAGTLKWKVILGEAVDIGGWFGRKPGVAYACTYVFSDRRREAVLRLDSNDHNRAWLNGWLVNDGITRATGLGYFHEYTDEVPIKLRRGWNRLLLQVDNRKGHWMMSGQVTDLTGQPIHDLTWQLERPGEMRK